jgi:predicted Zn-dependent peptidase
MLTKASKMDRIKPTMLRLSNGLTLVAESMPVEAVNLSLWLNVGSALESNEINGMAHFLEHMVFKGTARLANGQFEHLIEGRGAVTNAATSQDYTHYYITTAPQDFAELAPHQVDVVLNASIPEDTFEQERLVILEEIRRSSDNPQRRIFQRTMEMAFQRLPYHRSVLGSAQVVAQLSSDQMRSFHHAWYQPASMTAVVVGNLPVETLVETVAQAFQQLGKQQPTDPEVLQTLPSQYTPDLEHPFSEVVRQEFVDASLQQARLVMMWRVSGLKDLSETYALDVIASVLAHGRTSRLVQDLREQRGLVANISASNLNYQMQGVFQITAQLPTENLATVEAAIAQHIHALQQDLISEAEINRVGRKVANRFVFGNETPSDRAHLYGYYASMLGDLEPALTYPERIRALSAADLQAAAQQYLSPDAYGVVILKSSH